MIDETCPQPIIDVTVDVIDSSKERTIIDSLLKSLDITKTTDIDKSDHTTIVGTDDADYIVGCPRR